MEMTDDTTKFMFGSHRVEGNTHRVEGKVFHYGGNGTIRGYCAADFISQAITGEVNSLPFPHFLIVNSMRF